MSLPTQLLETFVAVAETGSFTRGGGLVCRTQSAVSMQMRRLEDLLGCALFERQGRRIRLSERGRVFLGHARELLRLEREALAALKGPEPSGLVRLGAPEDYSATRLPGILADFARQYPKVLVEVHCSSSIRFAKQLREGTLDLALAVGPPDRPPARVQAKLAVWEPVEWTAAPDFTPREDEALPLALFDDGCVFRRWSLEALDAIGRPWRLCFVSSSLSGVLAAVRAGLAVAPVGRSYVPADLRTLGVEQGMPPLPVAAVWLCRNPKAGSEAVEYLASCILDAFRIGGRTNVSDGQWG